MTKNIKTKPTKKFNVSIHFVLNLNEFENLKTGDEVTEIVQGMIRGDVDWPEMKGIEIKTERIVRCEYR